MSETKKPNPLVFVAALAAAAWFLSGGKLSLPEIRLPIPGVAEPAIPAPSAELQTAVAPVQAAMRSQEAQTRRVVAGTYLALADVIAAGEVTTTGQFRELHRRAGLVAAKASGSSGLGALNTAASDVFVGAVGLDNAPLDEAKRKALVDAARAIAWASS